MNHWLSFFPYVFRMLEFSLQYGRASYICWVMIYGICKMRKRKLFKQMQCGPEKQSGVPEIHRSDGLYQRENESLWIRQRKRARESSSHSAAQCYFKPWFCPTSDKGQSGKYDVWQKTAVRRIQTFPVKKMTSTADKFKILIVSLFYPLMKNKTLNMISGWCSVLCYALLKDFTPVSAMWSLVIVHIHA